MAKSIDVPTGDLHWNRPPTVPQLCPSLRTYTLRHMKIRNICRFLIVLTAALALPSAARTDDAKTVKKAVERSTLNQPGTKPFHLKAELFPTLARDRGSNRTGQVEYWWASPTKWKREVRCPEFHQIAIVNGEREWQKNDGDYLPEWLREISVALIEPVPSLDKVLQKVAESDARKLLGLSTFSWSTMSTDGTVEKGMGAIIEITDSTGLLQNGSDIGWSWLYEDYRPFHGRMVARKVSSGSPEVTAVVTMLEDLGTVPDATFDAGASGGDSTLLKTVIVDELSLRKNLIPAAPIEWPPIKDGPLEGVLTTEVVVDRSGTVRQLSTIVSDNPAADQAAGEYIRSLHFKPYLQDGVPVQVLSRITMPFKTVRPAGVESFESARTYFEHGRQASFPAAGKGQPYVLRATFQAAAAGGVQEGQYVDTWKSDSEWRREATIAQSRCVRSRHGEKRYQLMDGPDARLLAMILRLAEPIPAIDSFVESDWRISRETVDGVKTIRVLSGYESPEGELDAEHARGYWFDENGRLVKTFFDGLETRRLDFSEFDGAQVAHQIRILKGEKLAALIKVTEIGPAGDIPEQAFDVPGHEWKREFTGEVR